MKLVMDTNVLVSAVLTPYGPPGQLLDLVLDGKLELVLSPSILFEYCAVLGRLRFRFDPQQINALLDTLNNTSLHVAPLPWPLPLPDANDEPSIATAAAALVPLVTGNLADYPINCRGQVPLHSPHDFLEGQRDGQLHQNPIQEYSP